MLDQVCVEAKMNEIPDTINWDDLQRLFKSWSEKTLDNIPDERKMFYCAKCGRRLLNRYVPLVETYLALCEYCDMELMSKWYCQDCGASVHGRDFFGKKCTVCTAKARGLM